MTPFWFQAIIFVLGMMAGTSICIVIAAYQKAAKSGHRNSRVVNGDMTGGDVVGRFNNRGNGMGTMQVNGRTFHGNNISMVGGRIIVDGKDVTDQTGVDMSTVLEIKVQGDVKNVSSDQSITITGNVTESVTAQGSVSCGDVGGDVKASGSVSCDEVGGNVEAGGSVSCDDVYGSVKAGGNINYG